MAGPIRQPIDIPSLERYINNNVPAIKTPLSIKQFGYGQSNPTYLLTSSNTSSPHNFVLRKKPPGKLLSKTAHRVDREYRILHALEPTDVAVPRTYTLCEDSSVIGTPFYIMEFVDGRIFEDPSIPSVTPQERTEMWRDAVRTLAKFHRVAPTSVGLEGFGKHSGFYDRQIALFKGLCEAQAQAIDVDTRVAVGQIPHFAEMIAFFQRRDTQPRDQGTFIHGDYKIDNVIFHKTEPRVIGILDWEMSTIGHPLADVTNLLMPHVTALMAGSGSSPENTEPEGSKPTVGSPNMAFLPGATPGLPSREDCIRWYAEVAGYDPTDELTWGDAFNVFKGSVIMQGIAARYAVRQASSARAADYGKAMGPFGEVAYLLLKTAEGEAEGKREKARL
ncbi:MAG: hypothetical protein M1828_005288 [Chrysothrix sp. TS-e1954]|nr:MAG: hypothetical protein M1828_005288 [Chrysothrix sp. TS-e1954]